MSLKELLELALYLNAP